MRKPRKIPDYRKALMETGIWRAKDSPFSLPPDCFYHQRTIIAAAQWQCFNCPEKINPGEPYALIHCPNDTEEWWEISIWCFRCCFNEQLWPVKRQG